MARQEQRRNGVKRVVRAKDASLTPMASRLLTRELRDAVGSEAVRVAPGRDRLRRRGAASNAVARHPLVVVGLLAALTVGAIVALLTHSWWALVAACGVHAAGTLLASGGAFELMKRREHVSLDVAARLEEEGVADPDRLLTELVQDLEHERRRTAGGGIRALLTCQPARLAVAIAIIVGAIAFMTLMGLVVHRL